MPGLAEHLSDTTGLDVSLVPIWHVPLRRSQNRQKELSSDEVREFSVALGLVRDDMIYD
jgi:hypothetical protein